MENISTAGERQLQELGRWFRECFFDKERPCFLKERHQHKWRSSLVKRGVCVCAFAAPGITRGCALAHAHPACRAYWWLLTLAVACRCWLCACCALWPCRAVQQSGLDFVTGFGEGSGEFVFRPYSRPERAEERFRPWVVDKAYVRSVATIRANKEHRRMARANEDLLNSLSDRFGLCEEDMSPERHLADVCYFKELVECERFWPRRRTAMRSMVTEEEVVRLTELAHWCWNKRFFGHGMERRLGGPLLREVLTSFTDGKLSIYAAHDYTLLALMGAAGLREYPAPTLSFASFLIFEFYKAADGTPYVRVLLNPSPFQDPCTLEVSELRDDRREIVPLCTVSELLDGL